ncbi:MAG: riboflavin synthase [Thermoleophilaceae bacterium]|jgi:riboflavin synthase|nr:riboflavin synthase [Thermoleophilaceae bacterium]
MFTGLVQEPGVVAAVRDSADGARIEVDSALAAELAPGDSIAVAGVCLTAVEAADDRFAAQVMAETLFTSTLGGLSEGDRVNLELPLRAADRLGGHIVQGHVDGPARVETVTHEGFARRLAFAADVALCRYVVARGSVALDGVSLTAADVGRDRFAVALIPETLERTTLGELAVGDAVNVEVDLIAKYVERLTAGVETMLEVEAPR